MSGQTRLTLRGPVPFSLSMANAARAASAPVLRAGAERPRGHAPTGPVRDSSAVSSSARTEAERVFGNAFRRALADK